jgi:hypothetical protein
MCGGALVFHSHVTDGIHAMFIWSADRSFGLLTGVLRSCLMLAHHELALLLP